MRWPKVIEPGSTCDQLVSLCDLYATLGEYLGVELASDEAVDSYSMLATLKFPSLPTRPSLVHQSIDGSLSLRRGLGSLRCARAVVDGPSPSQEARMKSIFLPCNCTIWKMTSENK